MLDYKSYVNYLRKTYSPTAFCDMWNDNDVCDTCICRYENGKYSTVVIENGCRCKKDTYDTEEEFFDCIDVHEIKDFEEHNGWMYK